MPKLYYQFPGTWFGDCMPFGKGNEFFLYHQRDNRNPEPFGEPFGWDLATTSDFVHYKDCGVAVRAAGTTSRISSYSRDRCLKGKGNTISSTPGTTAITPSGTSRRRC